MKKNKKMLLALQAWEGDVADVTQLARTLTDLQCGEVHQDVDLLLVYRRDLSPRPELAAYCASAFDQVHVHVTRPRETGFPAGPNGMWCDVMGHCLEMHKKNRWDYECVFTTEGDAIPLRVDWANALLEEWRDAGASVVGCWMDSGEHSCGHINGNALFHPRLAEMISIASCTSKKAWDTNFALMFERIGWHKSAQFVNEYQRKTIANYEIQALADKGVTWLHGIKDGSARRWLRTHLMKEAQARFETPEDLQSTLPLG